MQESISRQIANIASKFGTDDIFVIGKGPSIDAVDLRQRLPGVVINLNDSERIYAGEVGVFSSGWVPASLAASGHRCAFYLAGAPLPVGVNHEVLPTVEAASSDEELALYRLEQDVFHNEPFVLLTALKFAAGLAKHRGRRQRVFLLGFDFSTEPGELSRRIGADYAAPSAGERASIVHAQEHEFRQLINYHANKRSLELVHVGGRDFSALTADDFNRRYTKAPPASPPPSTPAKQYAVLVVAELTNNHLGDADRLVEMVHRAQAAGANLIKVQKRDVATFYTREQLASYYWSPFGTTLGAYREGVELSDRLVQLLDETCRKCGIEWFCSVLDYPSYQIIKRYGPKLIKIPSTISEHRDLHARIAAEYRGPLVVSTGFTEAAYLDHVLSTFAANERIYLMHCVSAYPTPRADCNVAVVGAYAEIARRQPRIVPSYSSHDLGSMGSMLAVAAGARMVEKHVKLGDVEWVHFDRVALDLRMPTFGEYIRDIRLAEEILGSPEKRILPSETHKYFPVKR